MSRYLVTLVVSGSFLALMSLSAISKFVPTTISNFVNHCQSLTTSLSFHLPHIFFGLVFLGVFLVTGVTLAKLFLSIVKTEMLRRKLSGNTRMAAKLAVLIKKLGLTGKVELVKDRKLFAFCLGLRKPKIYLSTGLIGITSMKELEAVLRHEKYHLEHKDSVTFLVAVLLESLFPFFPLFSDIAWNFRIEKEIQADRQAISGLDSSAPLVSILQKLLQAETKVLAFAPAVASYFDIEARISALRSGRSQFTKFRPFNILVSLLSLAILLAFIAAPISAIELHNGQQDTMLVCVATPEADRSVRN